MVVVILLFFVVVFIMDRLCLLFHNPLTATIISLAISSFFSLANSFSDMIWGQTYITNHYNEPQTDQEGIEKIHRASLLFY